jgi:hypothetical protein
MKVATRVVITGPQVVAPLHGQRGVVVALGSDRASGNLLCTIKLDKPTRLYQNGQRLNYVTLLAKQIRER